MEYRWQARNPRALLILAVLWALILFAWTVLDAAPWIVVLAALALVPALFEVGRNTTARFTLTDRGIDWETAGQQARVARDDIARLQLDTRLDLTLRATLWRTDGTRLRIPPQATPPARLLLPALDAAGYDYTRRHFSFL